MALTKKFFCDKALAEIGLQSYVYDMDPQDYDNTLSTLNAIIAEWEGVGIQIGDWPQPADPSDMNDLGTIVAPPQSNQRVIWCSLAVAIAPNFGVSPEGPTIAYAKDAYEKLLVRRVEIPQMQRPSTMPIGTGWNRGIKDRQFYQQVAQLTTGTGQSLDIDVWDQGTNPQPLVNPTP